MPDVQPNALQGCPESWSAGSWSIPEGGSGKLLFDVFCTSRHLDCAVWKCHFSAEIDLELLEGQLLQEEKREKKHVIHAALGHSGVTVDAGSGVLLSYLLMVATQTSASDHDDISLICLQPGSKHNLGKHFHCQKLLLFHKQEIIHTISTVCLKQINMF